MGSDRTHRFEDRPEERPEERSPPDKPPDGGEARRRVAEALEALASVGPRAVEMWTIGSVTRLVATWTGAGGSLAMSVGEIDAATREAARRAAVEATAHFEALMGTDPLTPGAAGPLDAVRRLHRHPTDVLRAAGVGEVERDAFEEQHFPDDVYGLRIHSFRDSFADVPGGEELVELHMLWGVAKTAVLRAERGSLFD